MINLSTDDNLFTTCPHSINNVERIKKISKKDADDIFKPTSFLLVVIFDILILICYNLNVVNQLVIRVLLSDKQMFKGIMKSLKNLLMNDKKYTH